MAIHTGLSGQADSVVADSSRAPKKYRNEVGMNVGPVALILLGAEPTAHPVLGLTYKRVFDKCAIRAMAGVRNYPSHYYPEESQAFAIDTMYRMRRTERSQMSYIGRLGAERRKKIGGGRFEFVYGADLITQVRHSKLSIYETLYRIDSIARKGMPDEFIHMTEVENRPRRNETVVTTYFGIGATAAIMLHINRHWLMLGQFRADAYYGISRPYVNDPVTGQRVRRRVTYFEFESGAPVSELSIFYKF